MNCRSVRYSHHHKVYNVQYRGIEVVFLILIYYQMQMEQFTVEVVYLDETKVLIRCGLSLL